jgi:hypothetical protein
VKVELELPPYSHQSGIKTQWNAGFKLEARVYGASAVTKTNQAGHCSRLLNQRRQDPSSESNTLLPERQIAKAERTRNPLFQRDLAHPYVYRMDSQDKTEGWLRVSLSSVR